MESQRPATPTGLAGRPSFLPRDPLGPPLPGPTPGSWPGSRARGHTAPSPLPAVCALPGRPWPRWRCPADRVVVVQLLRLRAAGADLSPTGSRGALGLGLGRLPGACPSLAQPLPPPSSSFLKGSSWFCGPPWRREMTGSVRTFGLVVSGW